MTTDPQHATDYLEFKGDGVFRANTDPSENHSLVLLVGELSVIIYPGPKSVLIDVKSYPNEGPCDEILYARSYVVFQPENTGVLEK